MGIVKLYGYDEFGVFSTYYNLTPPIWDQNRNRVSFGSYVKISGDLIFVGSETGRNLNGEVQGRAWLYNCTWTPTISCDLRWNMSGDVNSFFGSSAAFMFNNTIMVVGSTYTHWIYDIRNLSNIFLQPAYTSGNSQNSKFVPLFLSNL